jgi:hypothetical protein
LKYLFLTIQKDFRTLNVDIKKFDQCKEVRNLNVPHNRDNFINLTIVDVLMNNKIISQDDYNKIFTSTNDRLKDFLMKKVKHAFQFDFLSSSYFRFWLKDPIKILDVSYDLNVRRIRRLVIRIVRNSPTIARISL